MKNYEKKITIRLSNENYEKLEKIKQNSKAVSLNFLVNMMIDNDKKFLDFKPLNFKNSSFKKSVELRIKISQDEYIFFKELSKKFGFNSANKTIKFLLINYIYDEKIFNKIDLSELSMALASMRRLGSNLCALIKTIRAKNSNITFNFDNVEKTSDLVLSHISKTSELIVKYQEILNRRI